jgi:hypothetical protein
MRRRPPAASIAITVLFAISGVNQLVQVPRELLDADGIVRLGVLHLLAGIPGIATAWGAWGARRWAWISVLAWAVATSALILSLKPLLDLPVEEAQGFVPAVIAIGIVGLATSWYLYRAARRPAGNTDAAPRD